MRRLASPALMVLVAALAAPASGRCPAGEVPSHYLFQSLGRTPADPSDVYTRSFATDIDERGRVVGYLCASNSCLASTAFSWEAGTGMVELPALQNEFGDEMIARAVASNGDVVGQGIHDFTSNSRRHAVRWRGGGVEDLNAQVFSETCSAQDSNSAGVNVRGQIVGATRQRCGTTLEQRGFIWDPDYGLLATVGSAATAINDRSVAIGLSADDDPHFPQGFVWDPVRGPRALGALPGVGGQPGGDTPHAINYQGTVVGVARSSVGPRGVVWNATTLEPQHLAIDNPRDINDLGWILGTFSDEPALEIDGTVLEIGAMLQGLPGGWALATTTSINNRGQIVGTAETDQGTLEAFLLDPVCEVCGDGIDNDADGDTDVEDEDCKHGAPDEIETQCDQALPGPPVGAVQPGLVLIAHGWDRRLGPDAEVPWVDDLAHAVEDRVDLGEWTVFPCQWSGGKGIGVHLVPEFARFVAVPLGLSIGPEIVAQGYKRVHLIGHSAGSWVVHSAAKAIDLADAQDEITVHTTFLDAFVPPEEAQDAESLGSHSNYAEHYVDTSTGFLISAPYLRDPTNIRLRDAHNFTINEIVPGRGGHDWPYEWYTMTAEQPDGSEARGWGFARSIEFGVPIDHAVLPRGGTTHLGEPGSLREPGVIVHELLRLFQVHVILGALHTVGLVAIDLTENALELETAVAPAPLTHGLPLSSSAQPAWAWLVTETDVPVDTLLFDYEFVSGDGGVLSAEFDGGRVFVAAQDFTEPGKRSATVGLGELYLAGNYAVSFRIDSGADTVSEVRVSNVRLAALETITTPIPTLPINGGVVFATLAALFGVALRRRLGRRPDRSEPTRPFDR